MKYFKNFTMFFSDFTLTRLTFLYVKHYLSFIYACCSSLSLSAGLLAWFACLSTGSNLAVERRASYTVQPSGGHRSEGFREKKSTKVKAVTGTWFFCTELFNCVNFFNRA